MIKHSPTSNFTSFLLRLGLFLYLTSFLLSEIFSGTFELRAGSNSSFYIKLFILVVFSFLIVFFTKKPFMKMFLMTLIIVPFVKMILSIEVILSGLSAFPFIVEQVLIMVTAIYFLAKYYRDEKRGRHRGHKNEIFINYFKSSDL